jgi:predicted dehydrogenase
MPKAVYAHVATLRAGGCLDDYCLIQLLHCADAPEVVVTLKATYLHLHDEPRFVLHGTHGSFVKRGVDPQEPAALAGHLPTEADYGMDDPADWGILYKVNTEQRVPTLRGDYGLFYQNIYEHLRRGGTLQTAAKDILPVIGLIEAAYRSSAEGKVVYV